VRLLLRLPQLLVRNITSLDVSGNRLKGHVSVLCHLPSLTELDASYNEIGKHGSALAHLTHLRYLNVHRNEVGEYISTLRPLIEAGTRISSDSL